MSNPDFGIYSSKGGKARAKALSKRKRTLIARNACLARWAKWREAQRDR
jgi:hypothetical protein